MLQSIIGILSILLAIPGAVHETWQLYSKWKPQKNSVKRIPVVSLLKTCAWVLLMALGSILLLIGSKRKQENGVASKRIAGSTVPALSALTGSQPKSKPKGLATSPPSSLRKAEHSSQPSTKAAAPSTIQQNIAPYGIANSGTINGGATVINNAPRRRDMNPAQFAAFVEDLKGVHGVLSIVKAGGDDAESVSSQLMRAAHSSGWVANGAGMMVVGGETPNADGMLCYAPDWNNDAARHLENAMKAGDFHCDQKITGSYNFNGISFGGMAIVIGRPISR